MPLTVKDELFAQASAAGMSNKDAAIAAGCPEKTASAAGSRFAKKPEVMELIKQLKEGGGIDFEKAHPTVANLVARGELQGAGELGQVAVEPFEAATNEVTDPLDYFRQVMNNPKAPGLMRLKAAAELAKYEHAKPAAKGVKDGELDRAMQAVGGGRYAPMQPPKPSQGSLDLDDMPVRHKGYVQ